MNIFWGLGAGGGVRKNEYFGSLKIFGYFWVNSNGFGVISVIFIFFMMSMYKMGIFIWVTKIS